MPALISPQNAYPNRIILSYRKIHKYYRSTYYVECTNYENLDFCGDRGLVHWVASFRADRSASSRPYMAAMKSTVALELFLMSDRKYKYLDDRRLHNVQGNLLQTQAVMSIWRLNADIHIHSQMQRMTDLLIPEQNAITLSNCYDLV